MQGFSKVQIPIEKLLTVLVAETIANRTAVFLFFFIISLSILAVGTYWPNKYTSFSIIQIDDTNILQPLMRGAAEATRTIDHATNAREIIFGEKIMEKILIETELLTPSASGIEKERLKTSIKERVVIRSIGENLLRIEYTDNDAAHAYLITKLMGNLFIEEGEKAKIAESQAAYEFIEKQVHEYLTKLTKVEEELQEFRTNNPDARPGLQADVSSRINQIQSNIEETRLILSEAIIKRGSLIEQLSGETAVTISLTREGQFRRKIAELQEELDTLRLDYLETYPDIVRLRSQIGDLKNALIDEQQRRQEAKRTGDKSGVRYTEEIMTQNPLYQQLRSELSNTETEVATLNTRISELDKMLGLEYERAKKMHLGEVVLSNLTRNYDVNQEIYQDLTRRLETARVSKNLDEEQKGLTYKIQEPSKIPLIPTGIRFIHFVIAGIALGLLVPMALIYFMIQVDPRIRFSQIISSDLNIPVLAEINAISDIEEIKKERKSNILIILGLVLLVLIHGYVVWLKLQGDL